MKPYTRSIVELFDGKKRYLIPLYQRQYAWKVTPQLDLLWEDIERAVERLNTDRASISPHFMGAIVISQIKTFGKQVQAFEIIDGQQRLTTFQLLLCALRDVAAANGSRYADELQKYLLNDGVMEKPEAERYKLWPSITDRRALVQLIDPEVELDSIAPKPTDEDGMVRRSTAAHAYFRARVEAHVTTEGNFSEERLERLFEAMKEGLAAVSIELEGGDDPQTIFETLNSRGVDLTPGDLLRNFIFQRAKGLGQVDSSLLVDQLYAKHWLPLDRAFWTQIASRGRQTRGRLDWMLTDHLSMKIGDLVSVQNLFEAYRRWILDKEPFQGVAAELESISLTAGVEERLFMQEESDPIGKFGRFADAFDVSTAMPLVLYLATEAALGERLPEALGALESYILRRDICGLTTKGYNRFFIGIIDRLRSVEDDKIGALIQHLSSRIADTERWPGDEEWRQSWIGRAQYKGLRQPRLRYIFEALETAKRTRLSEDIQIKSALSIEHIMPQKWRANWPVPGFTHLDPEEVDPDHLARQMEREAAIDTLGNLTLLTGPLNASVSNGPFSVKMPAVRAHSSLALNRDLNAYDIWDEERIVERAAALFQIARKIWAAPLAIDAIGDVTDGIPLGSQPRGWLPAEGTEAKFTYSGQAFTARVEHGSLFVAGFDEPFASFSAASRAVTRTHRNGLNDWLLREDNGEWTLADLWRRRQTDSSAQAAE
ncbi:DUF262 domain-containing protein [Allosphingosinicella deserti]|uniref:DUF262 domain-containing protein n=1 Tax=Allosphingosinicella deserti TaxID=2116704 RepID=A0A2P7QSQ9_9SPHN|nr:DUF262 domain-containing protein [Sphingomonas deserti]PSJ40996.1 DUF262 domain-containing protein [Sphingomonas deserti]